MPSSRSPWSKRSLTAQAMGHVDPITKAVVPPIHVATTYIRDEDNAYSSGFVYGRPTMPRSARRKKCWPCWRRPRPAPSLFSSGMAAATAVFQALDPGDHIVASKVMYWALRSWLMTEAVRWGLKVDFVETDNLDALREAIKPGQTKLVWIETPSNPSGPSPTSRRRRDRARGRREAGSRFHNRLADPHPPAQPRCRHRHACGDQGAERPFRRGGGALAGAKADAFWTRVANIRKMQGAILGPSRPISSRHAHAPRAHRRPGRSAPDLAQRFSAHPKVARVLYPGLPQHPGHDIAARQMENGFGYMLSIQVSEGEAAAIRTAARVGLWKRATSLGGVESLIEHRASIEGPGTPCPPDLLRLLHRHRGCRGPVSRSRRGAAG